MEDLSNTQTVAYKALKVRSIVTLELNTEQDNTDKISQQQQLVPIQNLSVKMTKGQKKPPLLKNSTMTLYQTANFKRNNTLAISDYLKGEKIEVPTLPPLGFRNEIEERQHIARIKKVTLDANDTIKQESSPSKKNNNYQSAQKSIDSSTLPFQTFLNRDLVHIKEDSLQNTLVKRQLKPARSQPQILVEAERQITKIDGGSVTNIISERSATQNLEDLRENQVIQEINALTQPLINLINKSESPKSKSKTAPKQNSGKKRIIQHPAQNHSHATRLQILQQMESHATFNPRKIDQILEKRSNSVQPRHKKGSSKHQKSQSSSNFFVYDLKETQKQANLLISEKEMVIPALWRKEIQDQIINSPLQPLIQASLAKNMDFSTNAQRLSSISLNKILSQILKGKSKWEMEVQDIEQMKSIDILKILDLDSKPISNYVESLGVNFPDIFQMEKLKTLEQKIEKFLKQPNEDLRKKETENVTFLTQVFKPTDDELADPEFKTPRLPNLEKDIYSRHLEQRIEKEISKGDKSLELQVSLSILMRKNLIKKLISDSENQAQIITKPLENTFERKDLMYWTFLEAVRQVSLYNRDQATVLLRSWHGFQLHQQSSLQTQIDQLKAQSSNFTSLLANLMNVIENNMLERRQKDHEMVQMRTKYEKTIILIQQMVRFSYRISLKEQVNREKLENLTNDLKIFMPEFEDYQGNTKLKQKLIMYEQSAEAPQNKKYHQQMSLQASRLPLEAQLLNDIERLRQCLESQSIDSFRIKELEGKLKAKEMASNVQQKLYNSMVVQFSQLEKLKVKMTQEMAEERQLHWNMMESLDEDKKKLYKYKQWRLQNPDAEIEYLNSPKPIQTSYRLMENHFLEKMTAGYEIRQNMQPRKLTQIEMKDINEYYINNNAPVINFKLSPITFIISIVRENRSEQAPRSVKKTLEFLSETVQEYIEKESSKNLDDFIFDRMLAAYGMIQIANRYVEGWLVSIKHHEDKDDRLNLFSKFLGLSGAAATDLPYLLFRHYLHILKIIKVSLKSLFERERRVNLQIPYLKIVRAIKTQISDQLDPFTRNSIYLRMMKVIKVDCKKNALLKQAVQEDVTIYESFEDMMRKLSKNNEYKTVSIMLNALFLECKMDANDLTASFAQADKNKNLKMTKKQEKELVNASKQKEKTIKMHERFGEDQVKIPDFIAFIVKKVIDVSDDIGESKYDYPKTLLTLLKTINKNIDSGSQRTVSRADAIKVFSQRIQVSVSLPNYIEIGMNAQIEYENNENIWFERVFYFYNMLEPVNYKGGEQNPAENLRLSDGPSGEGLELVQFFIFLKDVSHWPYAGDRNQTFLLYEQICQEKNTLKMTCDDFITFIKKNDSIRRNKQRIAKLMVLRFQQVKMFKGIQQTTQLQVVDTPGTEGDANTSHDDVSLNQHLSRAISQMKIESAGKQLASVKISYIASSSKTPASSLSDSDSSNAKYSPKDLEDQDLSNDETNFKQAGGEGSSKKFNLNIEMGLKKASLKPNSSLISLNNSQRIIKIPSPNEILT